MSLKKMIIPSLMISGVVFGCIYHTTDAEASSSLISKRDVDASYGNVTISKDPVKSDSETYGTYIGSGTVQNGQNGATMTFDIYDKDGFSTAVYGSGLLGKIETTKTVLPVVNQNVFLNSFQTNSLSYLFNDYNNSHNYGEADNTAIVLNNIEGITDVSHMLSGTILTSVNFQDGKKNNIEDMSYFLSNASLASQDFTLKDIDTSNVFNFKGMFSNFNYGFASTFDVSTMNTSKSVDMSYMFDAFKPAQAGFMPILLDLGNFDTSGVKTMESMFRELGVGGVNVSSFNTENVDNMDSMFESAALTKGVDVSSFNTKNVTSMSKMFFNFNLSQQFKNSIDLDLGNFITPKLDDTSFMFGSANIKSLNISQMEIKPTTNTNDMFINTKGLKTITYSSKFGPLGGQAGFDTKLPKPKQTSVYTGGWHNMESGQELSHDDFLKHTPTGIETWTWERVDGNYDSIKVPEKPAPEKPTPESPTALDSLSKTNGMLTFVQNKEVANPDEPNVIDPLIPDTPINKPENGSGGSGFKDFYINYVTNFNFNDIEITGSNMSKFADLVSIDNKEYAPFVQVTDNRGLVNGWQLDVLPTTFTSDTDELKGASLIMKDGVIVGSNKQPTDMSPVFSQGSMLSPGSVNPVMSAASGKGYGTWTLNFTDKEDGAYSNTGGIQAQIPVSALPKVGVTYTADLVWTLSATP